MLGSKQRATLAYRPQSNGQQENSVQTVIRSVRAYVQTADQSEWDELAEKLMWALNTSYDFTRLETPIYLVHGWDARGTLQAMMEEFPRDVQLRDAYEWRQKVQRQVEYAKTGALDLQAKAKKRNEFRYRLQTEGTDYRFYLWVHVSRLKPRAVFPERPSKELDIPDDEDFDATLLQEDSWELDESAGEFEVEAILDVRWITRARTSRRIKEYKIKWKDYEAPEWVPAV
ncbi:unnamed protein product [Phytophthora fragariaefolia]|uniref:Unnamed protein product n=1 Tax=Phytophthora fragariaefolia TaxID=1490495 RepID=A0A9W7D3Z0_9STRA|nr:unnamed protein product [Phytophthora fragariaefolia]